MDFWDSSDPADMEVPRWNRGERFRSKSGPVKEVRMRYRVKQDGGFLTSIQLVFGRGSPSETYGFVREGDKEKIFKAKENGDFISKVYVKTENHSNRHGLRFGTNCGHLSEWFGYDGSKGICIDTQYKAPPGHALVGFRGRNKGLWQKVEFEWGVCPTRAICKLVPIIEIKKGTGLQMKQEYKIKVGTKSQNYSRNQIKTFSMLASGTVNWDLQGGSGGVDTRMRNAFQSAFDETSQEEELTVIQTIDARKHGCFLYRPVITIDMSDGNCIEMNGRSPIGSPTRLSEYPFDYSQQKTSCSSSLCKVLNPSHW